MHFNTSVFCTLVSGDIWLWPNTEVFTVWFTSAFWQHGRQHFSVFCLHSSDLIIRVTESTHHRSCIFYVQHLPTFYFVHFLPVMNRLRGVSVMSLLPCLDCIKSIWQHRILQDFFFLIVQKEKKKLIKMNIGAFDISLAACYFHWFSIPLCFYEWYLVNPLCVCATPFPPQWNASGSRSMRGDPGGSGKGDEPAEKEFLSEASKE